MIELRELTKRFEGRLGALAVDRVSLRVEPGECVALVGASGSGKTTTLRMINRLIEASSGTVWVDGVDVREQPAHDLRRSIGYVVQGSGLFPHLDVAANLGITPKLLGWSPSRIAARVQELLELVELEPARFAGRRPDALSGGERQRVAVARALAAGPRVLLMDEPFGALDPSTRGRLQDHFRSLRERLGFTTILVTHDMAEAIELGDRIGIMREGRLIQIGTPRRLMEAPADAAVRDLLETPRRHAQRVQSVLSEATA